MLTTKQQVLRRFWYAVIPLERPRRRPQAVSACLARTSCCFLMRRKPAALKDRCCHRTAKLSKGWCNDGKLVCGYHGWTYDRTGKVVHVPQLPLEQQPGGYATPAYHCEARYGYAWVALDEPLAPILDASEENDPAYRRIPQFYEVWNTSAFRLMENSFDNAHFAFVHKGTFGQLSQPMPEKYQIDETDYGFEAETLITVANPPVQYRIAGTTAPTTKRHMRNKWYMPFCRKLDIEYPSGFATSFLTRRHRSTTITSRSCNGSIATIQRPIARRRSLSTGISRSHAKTRTSSSSTDPDTPIDMSRRIEAHMPSDRPGMLMRRRLNKLFEEHGEAEMYAARNAGTPIAAVAAE